MFNCLKNYRIAGTLFFILLVFLTGCGTKQGKITGHGRQSVEEMPFVCGVAMVPRITDFVNNRDFINRKVPGQTHVEVYVIWRGLEKQPGVWDFRDFEDTLGWAEEKHQKILIFPWVMYTPDWFRKTADYVPLVDLAKGKAVDCLSPWAPQTRKAFERFYAELAKRYKGRIDRILLGYVGSDYGEVGLVGGANNYVPGGVWYQYFPQDPNLWQVGYWCGDRYAREDFIEQSLKKYGSLEALNKAWATAFTGREAIAMPDLAHRDGNLRRWVDFNIWYQDSQTRHTREMLHIIRKYFPDTNLEIALGYASEHPHNGNSRTDLCKMVTEFDRVSVRMNAAAFNRGDTPLAYWLYKRMAPVCHEYRLGLCTEPVGGDLTYEEMQRQFFEDASTGVNQFYTLYQNYNLKPNMVEQLKAVLRPGQVSQVDIGILYPSTQMIVDLSHYPDQQPLFCDRGRDVFDYDLVDENMIQWGLLKNYRVLIHTSGTVYEKQTLEAIRQWVLSGGILVTRGQPDWQSVEGQKDILVVKDAAPLLAGFPAGRVGKGYIYPLKADSIYILPYLDQAVTLMTAISSERPLRGFDGRADGLCTTQFDDGRLIYDVKTRLTHFEKK